jgi:hypothetical protein
VFSIDNSPIQGDQILAQLKSLISSVSACAAANDSGYSDFECGICYSDYLDGQLTDFQCSNSGCNHAYHQTCLLAWFKANPACQCNFNYYTGPCLFCEEVKLGDFKDLLEFFCFFLSFFLVFKKISIKCK